MTSLAIRLRLLFAVLIFPALMRADIVINEIMYHPSSERISEEYIELHNTGTNPVSLDRWSIVRGVSYTFPNVTIAPGGYLVVAADRAVFSAKYPAVTNFVAGWTGRLSNSRDSIVLKDDRGITIDQVDYADDGAWSVRERDDLDFGHRGWRWRSPADGYGKSLELINAAFDNNSGQNWGASAKAEGTPGEANSIAASDIAPLVSGVRHFPLVPSSDQTVTVSAVVIDDRGATVAVTVTYRKDGSAGWTTVAMFDDGAHNDGLAGDNVFGARLPAEADGSIVEFYITATDGGRARTWPAPALNNAAQGDPFVAEQSQNCLYQVDNKAYFGAIPLYRLILKAADRATLASINLGTGKDSHARFNATFLTMDGVRKELRYLSGVRNRGHNSADKQPQSFNVTIPNDSRWNGRTALNLNSQFTYLQLLGSAFMRRAGLTAPESRPVQIRVNNLDPTGGSTAAPSYGFYVCNEVQDSDFTDYHFPTDANGNLYGVRRDELGRYQEGDFAHLAPAGINGADPYRPVYFKGTNASEDEWSDLVELTRSLAKGRSTTLVAPPTWDADYVAAVQATVDVDQWMTWFAAQMLIGNGETNLSNGYGDDFSFYIGVKDRRARLIPYDLDTILGGGDSPAKATDDLFPMIRHGSERFAALTPTVLYPLLRHPAFGPLYFAKLQQLLSGPLSIANVNALADQVLSGVVGASSVGRRKEWYAARHAYVSDLVGGRLSVTSGPAVDAATGYPRTTVARCDLVGKSDPARTQGVKVNGVAASYVPWRVATATAASNSYTVAIGEWSLGDIVLQPGINRLLIQAHDAAGNEIERTYHEVWYDDGSVANVAGSIAADTTWTAAGGPYQITAPVTVNNGVTLTIEPGASVYLAAGVGLTVAAGGRLLAEGTEAKPIYFTRAPGATTNGGTLTINGAAGAPETRFRHVFFNFGGAPAVVCAANSNVILDYCEWLRTDVAYLHLDGGSFVVSNCIFPSASANSYFEGVHGKGSTPAGGRAIIRDSFFGKCHSTPGNYNDVIDFTGGNRPGPILQVYNNVFLGSDDDILDLDGTDAWIEGNIFMHVHRVNSPDSASAVSSGDDNGRTSELTLVGNLFYDVDQAVTAKQGNFVTFLNNTVVDQNSRGSAERSEDIANHPNVFLPAVLNVADHGSPGARGMYVEGNLIHSAEKLVRNYTGAEAVTFNNNLLPPDLAWSGPGSGNTSAAALLNEVVVDAATGASNIPTPTKDNYRRVAQEIRRQFGLDPRSPARGTGPNGSDKGGVRALGVTLGGAPSGTTNATTATVTTGTLMTGSGIPAGANQFPGGAGWPHYKWRLDGGAWSGETPTTTPITLTGLTNGTHTLEVVGKNDANTFQDTPELGPNARISSATWRVDTSYVPPAPAAIVRINEVLASNATTASFGSVFPDIVELANVGNAPADLSGWGLTDNAALPYKYTFPAGTTLAPGAFLVVYASGNAAVPAPLTGFALGASGDDLTLTRSAAAGGGIADKVAWGQQIADFSIGRLANGAWGLCRPTFGAANAPAAQSPAISVRINEWLADASTARGDDFVELHNPGPFPVDLGGYFLTDNPVGWPTRSPIPPLTFIRGGGYLAFTADNDPSKGPSHAGFRLSPVQGEIGFVSPSLTVIDHVIYGPQRTDVSQGRASGGGIFFVLMVPTPGVVNFRLDADYDGDGLPDIWEIAHGFDPTDPADASLDADGDGQSNRAEYIAGTNPRDPSDFRIPTPGGNPLATSRLINISVLASLIEGEVMAIGTVIGGAGTSGTKAIVARAAGPALTQFGVSGVLPDPKIALIGQGGGAPLASNGDWAGDPALSAAFARVGAFPYGDPTSKDAGISQPALAAANYTVQVSDAGSGAGTVIAELYDATPASAYAAGTPRLINVSVLKRIAPATPLTLGFAIEGTTHKTVLVRAVGPTLGLQPFNLSGAMADPSLQLFDNATGAKIGENNDWAGAAALSASFAAVGAFALGSSSSKDAVLLVNLAPGRYSAQVRSAAASEGLVIVEVYEVP
ncbi:MAG: lamin tail domain-containing protein [Opitutaceae bacterium]|nr:lamin tail domain-containing protein [Opitutaceae bacterium]